METAPPQYHGRLTLTLLGEAGGRPLWRVEHAFRFWSPLLAAPPLEFLDLITVPEGFVTDLASVPRVPIAWLLAGGCANGPAVLHDFLYAHKWPSKALADAVFYEAMGVHRPEMGFVQVGQPKRWAMYTMVKLFGRRAWLATDSVGRLSLGAPERFSP